MSENYGARFSDAVWKLDDDKKPTIVVGGAGTIGSWLMLFLSRTRNYSSLYLYETDSVDETNIAGQFFSPDQIGLTKHKAIDDNIRRFSGYRGSDCLGRYNSGDAVGPIVMVGYDNMKARKEMFDAWKTYPNREVFIDGRMSMENGQVYTVIKGEEERYEKTLFSDEEVPAQTCSLKSTTHCGAHIASVMIASLNNYLANKHHYEDYIREIPFKYEFSFASFTMIVDYVKTE